MPRSDAPPAQDPVGTDSIVWRPPASHLQERWYRAVDDRKSNYNVLVAWRLRGPVDPGALGHALGGLAARHEVLRTSFDERDGRVEQCVHRVGASPPVPLTPLDLRSAADAAAAVRAVLAAEVDRPFALREAPLWRAVLIRLDREDHVLALVLHHGLCDGWSSRLLERDLVALHRAATRGEPVTLPEPPLQFGDVASWERSVRDAERESWWRARLSAADGAAPPGMDLPFVVVRHPVPVVPAPVVRRLTEVAAQCGATLATAFSAAAAMALAPALGTAATFGVAHANRGEADLQAVVGPVFDYLPVRVDLHGAPTASELIARFRREEHAARDQALPLGCIERAVLGDDPPKPHRGLFDVVLNFIPSSPSAPPRQSAVNPTELRFTPFDPGELAVQVRADHDFPGAGRFSVVLRQTPDGDVAGHVYGRADALGRSGLARLARRVNGIAERIARDPTTRSRTRTR